MAQVGTAQIDVTPDMHGIRLLGIVAEALSLHDYRDGDDASVIGTAVWSSPAQDATIDKDDLRLALRAIAANAEIVDRLRMRA